MDQGTFNQIYPLLSSVIWLYRKIFTAYIEESTGFIIELYADAIIAVFALMMPMIFGALIGFSILDDRDDNVLMTIKVTPLGLKKFFAFRLIMIFILAILASIFVIYFADIGNLELSNIVAISIVSSLSAPLTGLFINSFASNKIEGFAIMKGFGVLIFIPLVSLFVFDFKELFFAFAPGFFPAKAVSALIRGDQFMYLNFNSYYISGWIYGIVLNIVAYRYFVKKL